MSPFDFINDINFGKKNLLKDDDKGILEKEYNSFIINRGLSYFSDTVLYANEMNLRHELDKKMQNDYLLHSIRPKKRFSKWAKGKKEERIDLIKQYFNYSNQKAREVLDIITDEEYNQIKQAFETGGTSKSK
tara:strand:+ start:2491 stop:2886 length:396 start_codon:yes stop_codon:yes gene_type:complete